MAGRGVPKGANAAETGNHPGAPGTARQAPARGRPGEGPGTGGRARAGGRTLERLLIPARKAHPPDVPAAHRDPHHRSGGALPRRRDRRGGP
ncbi:Exonuclease SbcC [Actinacidiphila cocklensis]|uniref:Exonuclease SbcC n=1 Tax=Actinacidiphila cocklensis TaxID=887465 RepID=A0A9W4DTN1_9ACTN|nr:Exonuclease SbcC [Actinacidiphila cocklensis]